MILIADAGGNKTDWRLLDGDRVTQYVSAGFNYKTHPLEPFVANLPAGLLELRELSAVYFYAAGIVSDEDAAVVSARLGRHFPGATVESFSDTLAAARALFGKREGFIGLLGTGSGAAQYDGRKIVKRLPSLGYVLGDEGSGCDLGRALLGAHLRGYLPRDLEAKFSASFPELSEQEVLEAVYRRPGANVFLSQFVPFITENHRHPYLYELISQAFHRYFKAFFPDTAINQKHRFRFTGSVAHMLSNILQRVAAEHQTSIDLIAQSPVAGLTIYHQQYE